MPAMTLTTPSHADFRGRRSLRMALVVSASAPAILLAASALASLAYFFAFLRPAADWLEGILPLDPADANPAVAILAAIGFAAPTVRLLRGQAGGWGVTIQIGRAHA